MSGFGVMADVQASRSIDGIGLIRLDQPMHQQLVAPGLLHGVPPGDQGDIRIRLDPIQHGLEAFAGLRIANHLHVVVLRAVHPNSCGNSTSMAVATGVAPALAGFPPRRSPLERDGLLLRHLPHGVRLSDLGGVAGGPLP